MRMPLVSGRTNQQNPKPGPKVLASLEQLTQITSAQLAKLDPAVRAAITGAQKQINAGDVSTDDVRSILTSIRTAQQQANSTAAAAEMINAAAHQAPGSGTVKAKKLHIDPKKAA